VRSAGAWRALPSADVTVEPLSQSALTVSVKSPPPVEAFELSIAGAKGSAILQQGYQSWSFSGAVAIPADVPRAPDGSIEARAAMTGNILDEVAGVSYGAALVGDPGGRALAIGASSAMVATTAIAATRSSDGAALTILYGAAREPLPAGASGMVEMPQVVVAATASANEGLSLLAGELRRALPTDARTPRRPSGGWFSWNELFDSVDEAAVRAHIDLVATELLPVQMPLVEIDDGWEVAWGDWRANTKFPSGMDGVATAIRNRGLLAGVWLAPFLVDTASDTARAADPTFFVRGADGSPLVHQPLGISRTFYVLDGTQPAAMALAAQPIAELAAAGFGFFKLDFLYAGALPGGRSRAGATGVQALRFGLGELRKAMGEEAIFNACGAPIFPVLGLADSLRIGSDTAFAPPLSLLWANVVSAARSTSARSFLGALVWLDGDQAQTREPYSAGEARAAAFVAALSGPAYALGDDLRMLASDRLAISLDPTVLDLAGASLPAVADDPLEGAAAAVVASPIIDALDHPGSTGAPPPTHFTMRGKSGALHRLTFGWTDVHAVKVDE
jgi:alpha-galactosidase